MRAGTNFTHSFSTHLLDIWYMTGPFLAMATEGQQGRDNSAQAIHSFTLTAQSVRGGQLGLGKGRLRRATSWGQWHHAGSSMSSSQMEERAGSQKKLNALL